MADKRLGSGVELCFGKGILRHRDLLMIHLADVVHAATSFSLVSYRKNPEGESIQSNKCPAH